MRALLFALLVGAATTSACAQTSETREQEQVQLASVVDGQFDVVEAQARIDYPLNITRYEILADHSLLVTDGASRLFRVKLYGNCARYIANDFALGFAPDGSGRFDRFGHVVSGGRLCQVDTVDRVERRREGV